MRVYAIGDLHLPGGDDKPMDRFGAHWERHFERIVQDWEARVRTGDVVLLPGDLSWAMTLDRALEDLSAICALPGIKLLLRGNHDYWWSSISRVRAALFNDTYAVQNDALVLDGVAFAGSRGWLCPGDGAFGEADETIYLREIQRLSMSLGAARRLAGEDAPIIAMTHYPPMGDGWGETGFTEALTRHRAAICAYGHTHAGSFAHAFDGEYGGVRYCPCACDGLDFKLRFLTDSVNFRSP